MGRRLVESASARAQQEQRPRRLRCCDSVEQRLGLHHHAGTAPERRVVDDMVPVARPVAQIVDPQVERAGFLRAAHHALA